MDIIRAMQINIKNKFIKKAFRGLKELFFKTVDYLGTLLFALLRSFRIIKHTEKFLPGSVKNILIIRLDRIGDLIFSIPAINALRRKYPEARLVLLVTSYTRDIAAAIKGIDEVLVCEKNLSRKKKNELFDRLKRYRFDAAAVLSPYFESAYVAFRSGARFRAGYPVNACGFLLNRKADIKSRFKHEIESCLDVVKLIGADSGDRRLEITLSKDAMDFAEYFFKEHGISDKDLVVGIHPGAFSFHVRWKKEGFAIVADRLIREKNAKVLFFSGEMDKDLIKSILDLMSETPIVAGPGVNLSMLAALIKKCSIFLGNNSGPLHIAQAVGTPTVGIFGNIHPLGSEVKWAPQGEKHIIVRKRMSCRDCHPGHCRNYECLTLLDESEVYYAIETQIKRLQG